MLIEKETIVLYLWINYRWCGGRSELKLQQTYFMAVAMKKEKWLLILLGSEEATGGVL